MRLLFYLLPALLPALAAPTGSTDDGDDCDLSDETEKLNINEVNDGPTDDGSAGIGVEFESPWFYFKSDGCSADDTNAAKKELVAGRKGDNWMLTADTGAGTSKLQAEYIVDGRKVKVGKGTAQTAGKEIAEDLRKWSPWTGRKGGKKVYLTVANNKCNPWYIDSPGPDDDADNVPWEPQVTAPMPLEAVYYLMKLQQAALDKNTASTNVLTGSPVRFADDFVLVTKQYFTSKPNGIDPNTITDDVLAFCSLVLTYAKNAKYKMSGDQSPKFFTSFMPRNDFTTLYNVVQDKLKGDLWDLVNTLACYKRKVTKENKIVTKSGLVLDKEFCSGTLAKPVPGSKLSGLQYENANANVEAGKTMSIKSWVENMKTNDLLRQFDQYIDGSLGGLGTRMETMYNSDRKAPLFEFRDIPDKKTSEIEQYMADVDKEIQTLHDKYKSAPAS
ncbi:uncharacterized protein N7482_003757 [Penicillium canariense]|uniref:Secreted protein n=1 Tax=Penicillium canariense TaxID=189055 RepID=A0A9W9I7F1_9EURO|nr:uncharacterized protein N7482_003757 [Penicillium canariense]KAJ5168163.1 hypothetical protein N7482_003757 [Penicillium canariense]